MARAFERSLLATGRESRPWTALGEQEPRAGVFASRDEASYLVRHVDARKIAPGESVRDSRASLDAARSLIQNYHRPAAQSAEPTRASLLSPESYGTDLEPDCRGNANEFRHQPVGRHARSVNRS